MSGAQFWFVLVLLLAVVGSGVQVALQTHEVRRLHADLQAAHRTQDELLSKYSRLLLERSTLAAFQNVERLAEARLAMQFPDTVERLEP